MSLLPVMLGIKKFNPTFKCCIPKTEQKEDRPFRRSLADITSANDLKWRNTLYGKKMNRKELQEAMGYKSIGASLQYMKDRGKITAINDYDKHRHYPIYFVWTGD